MDESAPPVVLDDGRVLEYAIVDETVQYTGRLHLYANDKRIGPVPRLAICENLFNGELLLVHCDEEWELLAVQAWNGPAGSPASSIDDVKRRAEDFYRGISAKWIALATSLEEAKAYYEDREKKFTCSFCGRLPHEVTTVVSGKSALICNFCIDEYHEAIHKPGDDDASLRQSGTK
jgi:hypothetical protein